VFIQHFIFTL
jgi:hypothetical protein